MSISSPRRPSSWNFLKTRTSVSNCSSLSTKHPLHPSLIFHDLFETHFESVPILYLSPQRFHPRARRLPRIFGHHLLAVAVNEIGVSLSFDFLDLNAALRKLCNLMLVASLGGLQPPFLFLKDP